MDILYCLSVRKDGEYHEHSVHPTFNSALVVIYDMGLQKFKEILKEVGVQESEKFTEDLKDINSIRKGYKPDKVTYLFSKKFRITKTQNLLTSKVAIENIFNHINVRFNELRNMKTSKRICFPLHIFDEKIKNAWYLLDEFNAGEVIENLEQYIQKKIDELKYYNMEVVQGMLERNNKDFIAVRFTDSQEYLLNKEIFGITVSPNTGYDLSLAPL